MVTTKSSLSRYFFNVLSIAIVVVGGLVAAAVLWAHVRARNHVYIYRLAPEDGTVTPEMLQAGQDVLEGRLDAFRKDFALSRIAVRARPPDRLEVCFRTRFRPEQFLGWVSAPGRVDFRLLPPDSDELLPAEGEAPPEGYALAIYDERTYKLDRPGAVSVTRHTYVVPAEPDLGIAAFAEVHFGVRGRFKQTVLTFVFRDEDVERFRRLTALNMGRRMAMLVDGELFFPPSEISAPVKEGKVQVRGYFFNAPLRKLVKMLNGGSLPCPLQEVSHQATR